MSIPVNGIKGLTRGAQRHGAANRVPGERDSGVLVGSPALVKPVQLGKGVLRIVGGPHDISRHCGKRSIMTDPSSRPLAVVGPLRPLALWPTAAVQLHETGHSCIAQHAPYASVGSAGPSSRSPHVPSLRCDCENQRQGGRITDLWRPCVALAAILPSRSCRSAGLAAPPPHVQMSLARPRRVTRCERSPRGSGPDRCRACIGCHGQELHPVLPRTVGEPIAVRRAGNDRTQSF